MADYTNPIGLPYIPHEYANDVNNAKIYDSVSGILDKYDKAKMYAKAVPEFAKMAYEEINWPEVASEMLFPFQYDSYREAQQKGEDYKFDPHAFAADVLEMLPIVDAPVAAIDVMGSASREGYSHDQAKKIGEYAGVANLAAESIPVVGGKVAKMAKYGPKFKKIWDKALTGTAIGTGVVLPSYAYGEASENVEPEYKDVGKYLNPEATNIDVPDYGEDTYDTTSIGIPIKYGR